MSSQRQRYTGKNVKNIHGSAIVNYDCWHNDKHLDMIRHFERYPLLETALGKVLLKLSKHIPDKARVCELGCGTGQNGVLFKNYVGYDMKHIINNVAFKCMPKQKYQYFDIDKDNLNFLKEYDCVLLSAFIDVMDKPHQVLNSILRKGVKYVILHRQDFTQEETKVIKNPSHGGWTYHSIMNFNVFNLGLVKYGYKIAYQDSLDISGWNDGRSLILKK